MARWRGPPEMEARRRWVTAVGEDDGAGGGRRWAGEGSSWALRASARGGRRLTRGATGEGEGAAADVSGARMKGRLWLGVDCTANFWSGVYI